MMVINYGHMVNIYIYILKGSCGLITVDRLYMMIIYIYIYNIYTEHVGGFDLTKNKSGNFVGNSVNYITKHSHNVG